MAQQQGNARDEKGPRKGLLDELSLSQVVAGALAAVTSVALSSKIGIAGSLIGVAVASVVSTVASQLYRGMLRRGSDKLRELASTDEAADQGNPYGLDRRASEDEPLSPTYGASGQDAPAPRVAPASIREAAHLRHQQAVHRRVMVAAVVSSLVAVAATALVILAATHGEGLGQRIGAVEQPAASTEAAATHAAKTHEAAQSPTAAEHAATAASPAAGDVASKGGEQEATTPDATSPTTNGTNENVPGTPTQDASGTQDGTAANQ
ncbi:hypothetical protein [uncultured Parolsenella sp.]|uniref:hypothetical protein n=1 Tax=uncultured Parolsenella sp. TaxID=2083008 RepID=UPI0025F89049|nr:hypothetical protein [uncultured Parolsenella sp.]